MAEAALALYLLYIVLAFGLRSLLQWRRTGSTGFNGVGGRPGSAEWLAGVGFVIALSLGFSAPVLDLLDLLEPIAAFDGEAVNIAGVGISLAGIALTLWAQMAMGRSWRIGVDPEERTELVTNGPFAIVRNPIFAAMIPTALGLVLMVPSVIAVAGLVALVTSLELQVRVVEEPHLKRAHPQAYPDYASRVGRFVPGIGRLARESA